MNLPTIEEIMEATGLRREGARSRLKRCREGVLPRELLFESKTEAHSRAGSNTGRPSGKCGDWQGLGNRPRTERLRDIQGGTEAERRLWRESRRRVERAAERWTELLRHLREAHGLSKSAAYGRVRRYMDGDISYEDLFRPPQGKAKAPRGN